MLGQSTTARRAVTAAASLFESYIPRRIAHGLYALRIARGFLGEALALKTALALDRNRGRGYQPYEAHLHKR